MFPCTQTQPNEATQFLVVSNLKNARTTYHITSSGEMKPPFNFLNIVAESGGRGHTEVTVSMYGQHPQESIDGPAMAAIPAHGRIIRDLKKMLFSMSPKASTYVPPTAMGLALNLSGHAIAC